MTEETKTPKTKRPRTRTGSSASDYKIVWQCSAPDMERRVAALALWLGIPTPPPLPPKSASDADSD